ncbi:MAG TPA: carboxypeptidase regulatory-like domain-containing protein, partial [Actinomycetota bacterium]|nr:carboxypeptidase regulatory-like domain-containing protein [Actinomycetota bacterium]
MERRSSAQMPRYRARILLLLVIGALLWLVLAGSGAEATGGTAAGATATGTSSTATATPMPSYPPPRDADGDGMPNRWERRHGLRPHRADGSFDPDRDRLTNLSEYAFRGDPHDGDTDGDGLRDGAEVTRWFTAVDVADQIVGSVVATGTCPRSTTSEPCPERRLFAVPVQLHDSDGGVVAETTSHTNGHFSFRAAPGTYWVTVSAPTGFMVAEGPIPLMHVTAGQDDPQRATIVMQSTTGPGVMGQATQSPTCGGPQREGEECVAPLEGATIDIKDPGGNVVASTTTGADGYYAFSLDPGSYTLVAEPFDGGFPIAPEPVQFVVAPDDSGPSWIPAAY